MFQRVAALMASCLMGAAISWVGESDSVAENDASSTDASTPARSLEV